ncbi:Hsp20/alpha crystallin family protein [Pelosinus sp. sgz500959]|uniref:Hsp20/alpha crystallin family protein n=1 Tax=Pelosinus sp. sgz500959 TaxID=3242472 RepID=UPI0036708A8E
MSNIMRRDTYNTPSLFRKSINDMFDHFSGTGILSPISDFANHSMNLLSSSMPIDVIDQGKEYVVKANLPGINKKDIDIQLTENVLTIKGSYSQNNEDKGERYLLQERRMGTFSRSIAFNEKLVPDKIVAGFKDGILEINIPKAEVQQPESIKINIGD